MDVHIVFCLNFYLVWAKVRPQRHRAVGSEWQWKASMEEDRREFDLGLFQERQSGSESYLTLRARNKDFLEHIAGTSRRVSFLVICSSSKNHSFSSAEDWGAA